MDWKVVGSGQVMIKIEWDWGLVSPVNICHLEECSLTSLSDRVETELVETARGRDWGVIIDSLATVHSPVVIAMIVNISVAVKHQTVLTDLFRQCS